MKFMDIDVAVSMDIILGLHNGYGGLFEDYVTTPRGGSRILKKRFLTTHATIAAPPPFLAA